jgi:hypothetical protein
MRPATERQLKALGRFGVEALRPVTRGEASHLIDESNWLDEENPTPPTAAQEWMLRMPGKWKSNLSKRQAARLIAGVMRAARAT